MFRFAHPNALLLLIGVLVLILLYILSEWRKARALKAFACSERIDALMPMRSTHRPRIKFTLLTIAMCLTIIALARPQFGSKIETTNVEGIEAMIVLDVSNSMLCQDLAPNRLENAKLTLSKLVDRMQNDKVGIILFAGDAFIQLPITQDNVSAKMFLSTISAGSVPVQGTAIGAAINLAVKAFGESDPTIGRTIIVLTDGENHEDDAPKAAADAAADGIVVNVVGYGSPEGAPIPLSGSSFRKDNDGNVIVTKLNEQMCQNIARAGGGTYVRADNSNIALRALTDAISKIQKGDLEVQTYSEYDEKFYVFAWLALFALCAETILLARKNRYHDKIKLF